MKILLALPLLALLGVTLAKEQVSTRTCTNNRCIECLNGFCRESRHKREASEEQNSSKSCSEYNDGQVFCKICENGRCYRTNNGSKLRRIVTTKTSKNCDNNGCHICENGNCRYEARGKRSEGDQSSSSSCSSNNGHTTCTVCSNGVCRTTRGKRDTMYQRDYMYTVCDDTGCYHCDFAHYGGCIHEEPVGKREISEGDGTFGTSCNTVNGVQTCRVCRNGVCHTTTNGKRDAGVQQTTVNCVNARCIVCRNGQCNEMRNRKREQSHSSSTTCTDGHCTKCANGSCTYYQESVAKGAK